jgi:hypothetical protein
VKPAPITALEPQITPISGSSAMIAGSSPRYRYWPVLVAVSMARPDSLPLPLMSVRM